MSFVAIINARVYWFFVVGMVVLTIGETLVYPGIPALVSESTPKSEAGRYQSLLSMSSTFARAIGPLVGGVIVEQGSYDTLYLSAIGVLIVSLIILRLGYRELIHRYD